MIRRSLIWLGILLSLVIIFGFALWYFQQEWHKPPLAVEQTADPEILAQQIESDLDQERRWQEQLGQSLGVGERLLIERLISLERDKIERLRALAYYRLGRPPGRLTRTEREIRDEIERLRSRLATARSESERQELVHQIDHALIELASPSVAGPVATVPPREERVASRDALLLERLDRLDKDLAGKAVDTVPGRVSEPPTGVIGQVRALWTIYQRRRAVEILRRDLQQQVRIWNEVARRALVAHNSALQRLTDLLKSPQSSTGQLAADQSRHDFNEGIWSTTSALESIVDEQIRTLQQWSENLRDTRNQVVVQLLGRVLVLLIVILLIRVVAWGFSRLPDRLVTDDKSRFYLVKIVSFTSFFAIFVALLFFVVGEVGAVGPVIGLAGAGLAIALQDVIVSLVGWFFIIGRMGLSVGDRVEINGVKGDVIDISVFRTALLEVGNWITAEQSTGRVVFFPNSFVFKAHFFNYHVGTQYVWDELHTVVTFESDWKHAAEGFTAIAQQILGEHTEAARRQMARMSRRYVVRVGKLTPIVYIQLDPSGVDLVLRYLIPVRERRNYSDLLTRKVLEFVADNPRVVMAYPTRRNIQETGRRPETGPGPQ